MSVLILIFDDLIKSKLACIIMKVSDYGNESFRCWGKDYNIWDYLFLKSHKRCERHQAFWAAQIQYNMATFCTVSNVTDWSDDTVSRKFNKTSAILAIRDTWFFSDAGTHQDSHAFKTKDAVMKTAWHPTVLPSNIASCYAWFSVYEGPGLAIVEVHCILPVL